MIKASPFPGQPAMNLNELIKLRNKVTKTIKSVAKYEILQLAKHIFVSYPEVKNIYIEIDSLAGLFVTTNQIDVSASVDRKIERALFEISDLLYKCEIYPIDEWKNITITRKTKSLPR